MFRSFRSFRSVFLTFFLTFKKTLYIYKKSPRVEARLFFSCDNRRNKQEPYRLVQPSESLGKGRVRALNDLKVRRSGGRETWAWTDSENEEIYGF